MTRDDDAAAMETVLAMWDEIRARGTPILARMRGSSMWPAVPEGSLVRITPCAMSDLRRGELATIRVKNRLVTHRVFAIGSTLTTWGDSVLARDRAVGEPDVLGRAEIVERAPPKWSLGLTAIRGLASARRTWARLRATQ